MWYALQTIAGEEEKIIKIVKTIVPANLLNDIYYLRCENVWKKQGKSNISVDTMFKGYVFINTDEPEKLYLSLKNAPKLIFLLADKDKEKGISFLSVNKDEEEFLNNLINGDEERIVRLSYVHRNEKMKIDYAEGPLEKYVDSIVSVDYRHRRVFVNIEIFGKIHCIKFGIKTDEDISEESRIDKWNRKLNIAKNRQLENAKNKAAEETSDAAFGNIKIGSLIYDLTGVYGDKPLTVKKIIKERNRIIAETEMFQMKVDVELALENVVEVE